MTWKVLRLELASSWQFPRGSAGRSYLIRLPLLEKGEIDTATLEAQPMRATVRRYWPNEADMVGRLVHTPRGFAIQYESSGSARPNGNSRSKGNPDERLYQFGADAVRVGEEILLTEPDGHRVRYRVAHLQ